MKKYYTKDNKNYRDNQIKRHGLKLWKKRAMGYYKYPCDHIMEHLPDRENTLSMICLGTRNENEKAMFDQLINKKNKIVDVKSLDISGASGADFIMDFNTFPDDWENKWDIIYSNSIDHTLDANDAFKEWIRILKPNGLLYLMFDMYDGLPTESDCCVFEDDDVQKIINDNSSNITVILNKIFENENYNH